MPGFVFTLAPLYNYLVLPLLRYLVKKYQLVVELVPIVKNDTLHALHALVQHSQCTAGKQKLSTALILTNLCF